MAVVWNFFSCLSAAPESAGYLSTNFKTAVQHVYVVHCLHEDTVRCKKNHKND